MELSEFNELLPTIPREEKQFFHTWFMDFQDVVTWETFKSQGYRHIMAVKEDIEKHILEVTGKPQQLKLAFMPTSMARTSPFFPMGKQEMKDRPLYQKFTIENRWGRITISGPKLSIYDESVLLALLVLAKRHKSERFQTTYSELCDMMNVSRGANPYRAISDSLKRLAGAIVDTELYDSDTNKKVIESITGVMITHVRQQEKTSIVDVEISPYFLTLYGANLTTSLDVVERSKLKGDTAKALYRFIQTHKPGPVPFGLLTLCHGINLNTEQPLFEIRRQLKTAIAELKKQNHIKSGRIDKADNVYLTR